MEMNGGTSVRQRDCARSMIGLSLPPVRPAVRPMPIFHRRNADDRAVVFLAKKMGAKVHRGAELCSSSDASGEKLKSNTERLSG
jgi:hypothetical protein